MRSALEHKGSAVALTAALFVASLLVTNGWAATPFFEYKVRDKVEFETVATVPEALHLYEVSSSDHGGAIDILTRDGKVFRLTRRSLRFAFDMATRYEAGDAIAYVQQNGRGSLVTRDGRILSEGDSGWVEIARVEQARDLVVHEDIIYVLTGLGTIVRVPGPGLQEPYYGPAKIQKMVASKLGLLVLVEGGVYTIVDGKARPFLVDPARPIADVCGAQNAGMMRVPACVLLASGQLQYFHEFEKRFDVLAVDAPLAMAHSSDGNNFSVHLTRAGEVVAHDLSPRKTWSLRAADPEVIDLAGMVGIHLLLRRNGEVVAGREWWLDARGETRRVLKPGDVLPHEAIIEALRVAPTAFTSFRYQAPKGYLVGGDTRPDRSKERACWRLLLEDLKDDQRPEVQATKTNLTKILAEFDPETITGDFFGPYLKVWPLLRESLAPIRAARGNLCLDVREDLQMVSFFMSCGTADGLGDEKSYRGLGKQLLDEVTARLLKTPGEGPAKLARSLKRSVFWGKLFGQGDMPRPDCDSAEWAR